MKEQNDAAKVRFFPPAIPFGVIAAGVIVQWLLPIDLGIAIPAPGRYFAGGLIVVGAILGLGLWSVVLFRLNGQSENPWKPTFQIEKRGPFRFTRNPMYLQMILVCIGVAIGFANLWILVLTPFGAWFLQTLVIIPEEEYLEEKFGDDYVSYKNSVRRWI